MICSPHMRHPAADRIQMYSNCIFADVGSGAFETCITVFLHTLGVRFLVTRWSRIRPVNLHTPGIETGTASGVNTSNKIRDNNHLNTKKCILFNAVVRFSAYLRPRLAEYGDMRAERPAKRKKTATERNLRRQTGSISQGIAPERRARSGFRQGGTAGTKRAGPGTRTMNGTFAIQTAKTAPMGSWGSLSCVLALREGGVRIRDNLGHDTGNRAFVAG